MFFTFVVSLFFVLYLLGMMRDVINLRHGRGDTAGRANHRPGQYDSQSDSGVVGGVGKERSHRHSNHPSTSLRTLQGEYDRVV